MFRFGEYKQHNLVLVVACTGNSDAVNRFYLVLVSLCCNLYVFQKHRVWTKESGIVGIFSLDKIR